MSAAARLTDICSGHGCFPSRSNVSASSNVFFNNLGAHRVSDAWAPHSCVTIHDSVLASGSSTVFVNGLPQGRVGDSVACGSSIASGSPNIFIGG
jgi:uncharacterized Zn-binding protein involved in type VI secretion